MQAALLKKTEFASQIEPTLAQTHEILISEVAQFQSREAFEQLFRYFGPRIKSMMMKSGATADLAEDLVQTVMMTVWRKSAQYAAARGSVSAWMFTIARNARIDHLRKATSAPYMQIDDMEIAAEDQNAEEATLASQRAEHVRKALAEVPKEQREILELSFHQDVSHAVIAQKLNIPLGTVKSRLRLAYAKLKTMLEDVR